MKQKMSQGFSLVEILIVVSVLAIITAVSVVSYTGMTQRGRNTARLDAARAYTDIMSTMAAKNPAIFDENTTAPIGTTYFCLGEWFTGGVTCNATSGSVNTTGGDTRMNKMKAVVASLPDSPREPVVGADGTKRIGPVGGLEKTSATSGKLYVYYVLEKPTDNCSDGLVWEDAKTMICSLKTQVDPRF